MSVGVEWCRSSRARLGRGHAGYVGSFLVFLGTVDGKQIHGIDLVKLDDNGLITELTVMVRPQTAAAALGEAVQAGLTN